MLSRIRFAVKSIQLFLLVTDYGVSRRILPGQREETFGNFGSVITKPSPERRPNDSCRGHWICSKISLSII